MSPIIERTRHSHLTPRSHEGQVLPGFRALRGRVLMVSAFMATEPSHLVEVSCAGTDEPLRRPARCAAAGAAVVLTTAGHQAGGLASTAILPEQVQE